MLRVRGAFDPHIRWSGLTVPPLHAEQSRQLTLITEQHRPDIMRWRPRPLCITVNPYGVFQPPPWKRSNTVSWTHVNMWRGTVGVTVSPICRLSVGLSRLQSARLAADVRMMWTEPTLGWPPAKRLCRSALWVSDLPFWDQLWRSFEICRVLFHC